MGAAKPQVTFDGAGKDLNGTAHQSMVGIGWMGGWVPMSAQGS